MMKRPEQWIKPTSGTSLIAALAVLLATLSSSSSAQASATSRILWPTPVRGTALSNAGNGVTHSIKYGTPLTTAQTRALRTGKDSLSESRVGNVTYGLGSIDQLQYPLLSRDGGKTWRIAGPYIAGPWADASAGGTTIKALGASTAFVYGNEWTYTTINRGRTWYVTSFNGTALHVSAYFGRSSHLPVFSTTVTQTSANPPNSIVGAATYVSTDGGASWTRAQQPRAWPTSIRGSSLVEKRGTLAMKYGQAVGTSLNEWPVSAASFLGQDGYGLSGAAGVQYPVRTWNRGETWHTAGVSFARPKSGGANYAISIQTLSAHVAEANSESSILLTVDFGHHWYKSAFPGAPQRCSLLQARHGALAPVVSCLVTPRKGLFSAVYLTGDGGRRWLLVSGQPSDATGDPGGQILLQLDPVVTASAKTALLNYVWKLEPHIDSCDGRPSTRGWSEVVLQMGLSWHQSSEALYNAFDRRLVKIGWGEGKSENNSPPTYRWTMRLTNGKVAQLSVNHEPPKNFWQLDAVAPPIGKPVSGC